MQELDRYRVDPDTTVRLADHDPREKTLFPDLRKKTGRHELIRINDRISELQNLLAAGAQHRLLIVLQAIDTGGKDGTIRNVFNGVNPQGIVVTSFGSPSEPEQAHDYLWRVHPHVPSDGRISLFNRSHYEDVLIVRVRNLVPEAWWRLRYGHINDFERMLVDEGTTILKFFLHISKGEQKERLEKRLADPTKRWKFKVDDLEERKRWDKYQEAFEAMLSTTSTEAAPWWIVPAHRKWYRDLIVSSVVERTLRDLDMQWPERPDLDGVVVE